jgi:hypothetical protein
MDGYLVITRCVEDDVPLRLCRTRQDAETFAAEVTEETVHNAQEFTYHLSRDTRIAAVQIVEFRGGVPVKTTTTPRPTP